MNTNLIFGGGLVVFGLATLVARFAAPESAMFSKLKPMQERLGDRMGLMVHVFAYTLVPLLAGATFVMSGLAPQP